jgi:hypothetical protein
MSCHGVNVFPQKQWDHAAWDAAVTMMSRREGMVGIIVPPGKLNPADRALLVDYLAANFGPNAKKRALATDADMPLDEEALRNAMYVEYDMPKASTPNARPRGQNPFLDNDGNVWVTDRGAPNAIVRLDPRTATLRAFLLRSRAGRTASRSMRAAPCGGARTAGRSSAVSIPRPARSRIN